MRRFALVLALSAVLAAPAQQGEASRALSRKDAAQGAAKAAEILSNRHGVKLAAPSWPASGELKRTDVIELLSGWLDAVQPRMRLHARGMRLDLDQLRAGLPAEPARKAEALIRAGFLAPVGPLVVGPEEGMTAIEFGDALGFFTARLERQAAEADPDYSPAMMWPY